MIINWYTLKNLPVYTKSGVKLGKIFDININIEEKNIYQFIVRLNFFSGRTFFIRSTQIIQISSDKIVVDDAVAKDIVPQAETIQTPNVMESVVSIELNK